VICSNMSYQHLFSFHKMETCTFVNLYYTRRFLTFLAASRPVCFASAGASLAERRARVLPMNQSTYGLQSSE
jgi:hypothetical protein